MCLTMFSVESWQIQYLFVLLNYSTMNASIICLPFFIAKFIKNNITYKINRETNIKYLLLMPFI